MAEKLVEGFTQEELEEMMYHHPKHVRDMWLQPEEDIWDEIFKDKGK